MCTSGYFYVNMKHCIRLGARIAVWSPAKPSVTLSGVCFVGSSHGWLDLHAGQVSTIKPSNSIKSLQSPSGVCLIAMRNCQQSCIRGMFAEHLCSAPEGCGSDSVLFDTKEAPKKCEWEFVSACAKCEPCSLWQATRQALLQWCAAVVCRFVCRELCGIGLCPSVHG